MTNDEELRLEALRMAVAHPELGNGESVMKLAAVYLAFLRDITKEKTDG